MKLKLSTITLALLPFFSHQALADDNLETIVVTGDFQNETIQTLSASASVVDELTIAKRGAQYLDEILSATANVNFTAGASRGRFMQIRGIGLRSQFVDPIYPSVGLLIDGINYSGLGASALLFDTESVVVYRGPQGTKFGSDALAGIVEVNTQAATTAPSLKVKLGAGNYGSYEAGLAAGTGLSDDTAVRVSLYQRESDGYVDNLYLNKPTQQQDEQVARVKLNSQVSDNLALEFAYHHIDTENGYDGFTLDNSRNSVADTPGQDNLSSDAFSLRGIYTRLDLFNVEFKVSGLDADTLYSYDEDWVCNDAAQPALCAAGLHPEGYSSTDAYERNHENGNIEFLIKDKQNDWVIGVFAKRNDVDLTRHYTWLENPFTSAYTVESKAIFGQYVHHLSDKTRLIGGLRAEQYDADYLDSNGFSIETDDVMWGGKVALEYQVVPRTMIYTSLTRGYKVGGVNGEALAKAKDEGLNIPAEHHYFDPEYVWNAEFGVKGESEDKRHLVRVTAFYMQRDDIQLKQWQVSNQQFAGYIDNASKGSNYGLEVEGNLQYTDRLGFSYSAGYLETEIEDFVAASGLNLDGRDQAQAPNYQYSFAVNYELMDNLVVELGVEGKDNYYLSDSHNEQARNHNLINASLSYYGDNWSLTAWGRNLADEDIVVRGFRFGNNPLDGWQDNTYVQYGEPRVYGLSFTYEL
ncbi:TonB-dependent receptor [Pseudoalteromonas piscicida]|uniref:TonB-dependent receptor n=1 Tax=Pseudoalteromonas piscicida TaxID=43662 RepID=UPI001EFCDD5E|nr:TonB-dependent receptor [Pseudoalteromonas piscicida]MCG9767403.1 TonB-dependent receptor [Pseudoalteromonas piscicida]